MTRSTLRSLLIVLCLILPPSLLAANRGFFVAKCENAGGTTFPGCTVSVTDYYTGSTVTTYSDNTGAGTALTNPIVMSAGVTRTTVYVDDGTYAYSITANGPTGGFQTGPIFVVHQSFTPSTTFTSSGEVRDGCVGTVGSAETEYLSASSVATSKACSGATTVGSGLIMALGGTLSNLVVASSANVTGGTGKDVATVYKNAVATTLTCTIAGAAKVCTDTTHSVTVVAGDLLTFQFITATSDTAANVTMAVVKQ